MWNEITRDQDIDDFMEQFGYFHDSCIKEMRYISGAFVDHDLSMHAVNDCRSLAVVFQRQSNNPKAIELEFSDLVKLNLEPNGENYTCEILDISMFIENGLVYWGDSDWFASQRAAYKGTWICAQKARWRILDERLSRE